MPIAPGNCIATCFTRHWTSARWQGRGNTASDSRTSSYRWTVPPSRCACRCFHGRNFATPRVPSNSTCCWIMTDICPPLPILPMGKSTMSPSPAGFRFPHIPSWPWTGAIMITGCLPIGRKTGSFLLPV